MTDNKAFEYYQQIEQMRTVALASWDTARTLGVESKIKELEGRIKGYNSVLKMLESDLTPAQYAQVFGDK